MPDITYTDHGSLALVKPETEAAQDWIDEHVDPNAQWFGDSLVVEPRYLENLLQGAVRDGLEVA